MGAAPPGVFVFFGGEAVEPGDAGGGLGRLAVEVPAVDPARLIPLAEGPRIVWRSPEPERDGRVWSILGWGEAARVDASGPDLFGEVRRFAARLFAAVRDGTPGPKDGGFSFASALTPRLFGGVSFPSHRAPARSESVDRPGPPWKAFGDASFSMPKWLYAVSGGRALLQVVARGDRLDEAAGELAAMVLAIEAIEVIAAHVPIESTSEARDESPSGKDRSEEDALASTDPEVWRSMVLDALARIRAGELEKVVCASARRVTLADPPALEAVIDRLSQAYPDCHVFAIERELTAFVGATPERLVTLRGLSVETDALAGSIRREPGSDEEAKKKLLSSDKDRREHALVVAAIDAALRPRCRALHVPQSPVVRSLRNVHHLHTPIEGDLAQAGHVLDLVEILHPTPAVCGSPREAALTWISEHEPAPRGWYAGALGWFDEAGDGSFSVAIRSALLAGGEAWLFAGAGVVEGSDPASELAETRLKQAPMLAALGVRAP
jgi:menaquinone-specific isochorismate synthase